MSRLSIIFFLSIIFLDEYGSTNFKIPIGGLIDTSFGINGISIVKLLDYAPLDLPLWAVLDLGFREPTMVVDAQRRMVVAVSGIGVMIVARFLEDGSLDTTFGQTGIVITVIPDSSQQRKTWGLIASSTCVAVDNQGRIILGGFVYNSDRNLEEPPSKDLIVIRYNYDGTLDTSFAKGGILRQDFHYEVIIRGMLTDYQDRIVVCGSATGRIETLISKGFIARFNEYNGSLDISFGDKGVILTSFFKFNTDLGYGDFIRAIVQDVNYKLLIVGDSKDNLNEVYPFIARYLESGVLDKTFNGIGYNQKKYINYGDTALFNGATSFILDPFQTIFVSASASPSFIEQYQVVAKYSTDGVFDKFYGTFGGLAVSKFPIINFSTNAVIDILGKIIAGAVVFEGFNIGFGLSRFTPEGVLDTSFGKNRNGQVMVFVDGTAYGLGNPANLSPDNVINLDSAGRINVACLIDDTVNDRIYFCGSRFTSDYSEIFLN